MGKLVGTHARESSMMLSQGKQGPQGIDFAIERICTGEGPILPSGIAGLSEISEVSLAQRYEGIWVLFPRQNYGFRAGRVCFHGHIIRESPDSLMTTTPVQ